jgi:hypothetical protein
VVPWTRQFGSPSNDNAEDVAVDAALNVLVTGTTFGTLPGQSSTGSSDAFVGKYTSAGAQLWTRQFGTSVDDGALRVSVGPAGEVLVAGFAGFVLPGQSSAGFVDAFVRKYDPSGTEVWTRQFGSSNDDVARAVVVDAMGQVFVAGSTEGALPGQSAAGLRDGFVRKYDASGTEVWTRQFGTNADDMARAIAVDTAGNVLVAGSTDAQLPGQTSGGGRDVFVRKYDAAGTEVWTRQFGTSSFDDTESVAVDAAGAVFVAGSGRAVPTGPSGAFVRKYDPLGTELWTRQFGRSGDKAAAVAVDATGNAVVAGFSFGLLSGQPGTGSTEAFVRRYDPSGTELATRQFGTARSDEVTGVAPGPANDVLLSGVTFGVLPGQPASGNGNSDGFVMRLVW